MAPLGATHDLLARALVLVVFTGGALALLAVVLLRRRPVVAPPGDAEPGPLAGLAGAGFAGVVAGALALSLGGPGALAWLALAALAGAAIQLAERRSATIRPDLFDPPGPIRQAYRVAHALAAVLAALAAGGLLLAQQGAEAVRAAFPLAVWALAAILALGTAAAHLLARSPDRARALAGAGAFALGLLGLLALAFLLGDRAAVTAVQAVLAHAGTGDAALGGLLGVAAHGVMRAAAAGAAGGLGGAAPATWRASLVAGAAALLTGLVLAAGPVDRAPVAGRELVPLEQNLRTGLMPSDYGQMIAISAAGQLAEGQRYPVVLRADPRGQRVGQLFREDNIVAVPAWDVLRDVDTVILRDKDPERAKNPGFDLRIAVTREVVDTPRGPFLKLAPVDPDINIRQLMAARDMEGPFLQFNDYPFVASVVRGFQVVGGERLSLFEEPRAKGSPPNPNLRDLVTLNFAGPYADRGEPRPPRAIVAPADSGLVPGTLAHLRLEAPARGLDLGFVNRLDELEVPPWDFLAACDTAILRHKTDPTQDREIRVTHRFAFGRLRFTSPDVALETLAKDFPEHTGPHLRPPAFRFSVEVHSGARLPPDQADASLALVPVHMHDEPTGNPGWGVYSPHPGEVLLTDMTGPFLDEDAAAGLVRALDRRWGHAQAGLAALCLLALAVVGLAAWAQSGAAAARRLFGPAAGPTFAVLFLACVALGPGLALTPVLRLADIAVACAVLLGVAGLLARLPRQRG